MPRKVSVFLRSGDAIESAALVGDVGVEVGPELDEEEGVPGPLLVELLQPARLLRELVLDLPHVHRLQPSAKINIASKLIMTA